MICTKCKTAPSRTIYDKTAPAEKIYFTEDGNRLGWVFLHPILGHAELCYWCEKKERLEHESNIGAKKAGDRERGRPLRGVPAHRAKALDGVHSSKYHEGRRGRYS